jgi:hypothetical protein
MGMIVVALVAADRCAENAIWIMMMLSQARDRIDVASGSGG